MKRDRVPIIGGGAGIGLSAQGQEAGGIDLLVIYNSGRYRMAARGSAAGLLAYGNANEIVLEMAGEILPVVKRTPVLAGVNGTDPFCHFDSFLDQLKRLGFVGIQNFPSVGVIDGTFRQTLEATGMGYDLEVELIALAQAKDLLTTPYIFSATDAQKMAAAGADLLVAHFGTTVGGKIGATQAVSLDRCVELLEEWAEAALSIRPDIIVLGHGGPLANPSDAAYLFRHARHCNGFYGASSLERLPVETALAERAREFKTLRFD